VYVLYHNTINYQPLFERFLIMDIIILRYIDLLIQIARPIKPKRHGCLHIFWLVSIGLG